MTAADKGNHPAPSTVVGRHPETGQYYERIGQPTVYETPVLWIHGGGFSGACYREGTTQGTVGWADRVAGSGVECWVTDWIGVGRSGDRRDPCQIRYSDVIEGCARLITDVIARPVVIVCHSMGGAVTWALVEKLGDHVKGVVGLAPAPLANNREPMDSVTNPDGSVVFNLYDGTPYTVRPNEMALFDREYSDHVWTADARRFPKSQLDWMASGIMGLSPTMLLERMSVVPGLPQIEDTEAFAGKPITVITGTQDPGHPLSLDGATAELLASWGAQVDMCWLGDRGIEGNSHFLFWDDNEAEVFEVMAQALIPMLVPTPSASM